MRPGAVTLEPGGLWPLLGREGTSRPELEVLFGEAERARDDVGRALELATRVAKRIPRPGRGSTALHLETLATLAAADVTVARVVEPHVDATMILAECVDAVDTAGVGAGAESTWGVFAAEGPGVRLVAVPDAEGWVLEGTKPWCSLAGRLTHALVTAHVEDSGGEGAGAGGGVSRPGRRLFAVDLRQPDVVVHESEWVARGLPSVPSGPTDFGRVPAVPVGATGWYLERAGFEWGGIGVAACWFGGAVGLARRVLAAAATCGDDISHLHAGRAAAAVQSAASALAAAAAAIDARSPAGHPTEGPGALQGDEAALLAQVTRSVVRGAAEEVLREAAHALGPAPLALDDGFAARVADLELYLRQDHGARDEARVGRLLVALDEAPPAPDPTPAPAPASAPAPTQQPTSQTEQGA